VIHFRHVATEAGGANGTEPLGNGDFELRTAHARGVERPAVIPAGTTAPPKSTPKESERG